MIQFYFLSVLLNLIAGLLLVFSQHEEEEADFLADKETPAASIWGRLAAVLDEHKSRLILGGLTLLVGLMKILSVIDGDLPVVGDLIPALAGIAGGFCLLLEYYMSTTAIDAAIPPLLERIFVDGRRSIGIFCLAAAVFHFILPRVLLL